MMMTMATAGWTWRWRAARWSVPGEALLSRVAAPLSATGGIPWCPAGGGPSRQAKRAAASWRDHAWSARSGPDHAKQAGSRTALDPGEGSPPASTSRHGHPRCPGDLACDDLRGSAPGGKVRRTWSEGDRLGVPRPFPQGRGLPVCLPGAYAGPRIHPHDRAGPLRRRLHGELGVQRVSRDPRSQVRPRLPGNTLDSQFTM